MSSNVYKKRILKDAIMIRKGCCYDLRCDSCQKSDFFNEETHKQAKKLAQMLGWKFMRNNLCYCGDCARKLEDDFEYKRLKRDLSL